VTQSLALKHFVSIFRLNNILEIEVHAQLGPIMWPAVEADPFNWPT